MASRSRRARWVFVVASIAGVAAITHAGIVAAPAQTTCTDAVTPPCVLGTSQTRGTALPDVTTTSSTNTTRPGQTGTGGAVSGGAVSSSGGSRGGRSSQRGSLPVTGGDILALSGAGVVLLGVGAAAVGIGRRRRHGRYD